MKLRYGRHIYGDGGESIGHSFDHIDVWVINAEQAGSPF